MNIFGRLRASLIANSNIFRSQIKKEVSYSVKKYGETYKLLEKYDASIAKSPEILSERRNVQAYLQRIQRAN